MRKVLAAGFITAITITTVNAPVLASTITPAAVPGCNLSEHWRVTASAKWNGPDFSYGVLNSPGPLRVTGAADGNWSEWFLWRGSDRTFDGTYHNRDESKPNYVYRTVPVPGQTAGRNIDKIVQVPMAESRAFCLITIRRP